MNQDAYNPDTGEFISTTNPAPWMGRAGVAAPAFDSTIAGCFWRNGAWAIVTADQLTPAKADQIKLVTQACAAAIISGFTSMALGTVHTYPSQPNDQTNLIGAVASGLAAINFWCADATMTWNFASHTAAQMKQVLADGGTQHEAYSAKLAGLVAQIQAAVTVSAVQAVVW